MTKYPQIKWRTETELGYWWVELGSVYISVNHAPWDNDRLFVTAANLLSGEDLWNQADIEAALDEAVDVVREAALAQFLEVKKKADGLKEALDLMVVGGSNP